MSPPAPAAASLALPSSPSADPSSASPSLAPSASAAPPPPGADTPACGLPAPLPGLLRSLCDAWDGGSSSSPCELPPPLAARAPDLARMGENSALYRDEGDATSPALMRPDVSREVAGVGCDASDVRSPDVLAEPLASATPMCDAPPPVERELDDITSDRRWRYRASCEGTQSHGERPVSDGAWKERHTFRHNPPASAPGPPFSFGPAAFYASCPSPRT